MCSRYILLVSAVHVFLCDFLLPGRGKRGPEILPAKGWQQAPISHFRDLTVREMTEGLGSSVSLGLKGFCCLVAALFWAAELGS